MAISPARLSRREWLQFLGAFGAAAALPTLPLGCKSSAHGESGFFTADERRALGALANVVLPPDDTPGGEALGAVPFIERLLTAFDTSPPMIFAGGPYSGRHPFSDKKGKASSEFPPNDFLTFLPLDRVSEAAWRLKLFGSTALEGGAPNEGMMGAVVGLRDQMKTGLATAMKNAPAPLETLNAAGLKAEFDSLDATFRDLLIDLVSKAAFSAPEYGGNPDLAGWKLANFEGDIQPLGYSIYDESAGTYRERPEAPMSTANPGPDPAPIDAQTRAFLEKLVAATGGKTFP